MAVLQRGVRMLMGMRLAGRIVGLVKVLMMNVMPISVRMNQGIVTMTRQFDTLREASALMIGGGILPIFRGPQKM